MTLTPQDIDAIAEAIMLKLSQKIESEPSRLPPWNDNDWHAAEAMGGKAGGRYLATHRRRGE